jgi:hypothetical protein
VVRDQDAIRDQRMKVLDPAAAVVAATAQGGAGDGAAAAAAGGAGGGASAAAAGGVGDGASAAAAAAAAAPMGFPVESGAALDELGIALGKIGREKLKPWGCFGQEFHLPPGLRSHPFTRIDKLALLRAITFRHDQGQLFKDHVDRAALWRCALIGACALFSNSCSDTPPPDCDRSSRPRAAAFSVRRSRASACAIRRSTCLI